MGFAEAVKVMRQQRRLTKGELAQRSGLAASYVSRLESGAYRSPSIETLVAIARGLEMDPRDLLVLGGYVPDQLAAANRALTEDEIARVTQDAIRRISKLAEDALTGAREKVGAVPAGRFDAESLGDNLAARRRLAGLSVNQIARRSRVPLSLVNQLERGEFEEEPAGLHQILRNGYGLSEHDVELLRIEMSLHSVLRGHPTLSPGQRLMTVDVAMAAMRREAAG